MADTSRNINPNKRHAKRILVAYIVGALVYVAVFYSPFTIPCLLKLVAGIPCPGCGISRAFMLARRGNFVGAATMNILFWPLAFGAFAYFVCAVIGLTRGKPAIARFNRVLANKWVIGISILLTAASWLYNIVNGI